MSPSKQVKKIMKISVMVLAARALTAGETDRNPGVAGQ
jgi:hypothetical protein